MPNMEIDTPVVVSLAIDTIRYIEMENYDDIDCHLEGAWEVYRDDDEPRMAAYLEMLMLYISIARDENDPKRGVWGVESLMTIMGLTDDYRVEKQHRTMVETVNDIQPEN